MSSEAVRVIVRCRPENSREKSLKCKNVVQVDEERNQIILKNSIATATHGKQDKPFTFDGSYGPNSKTSTIYAESAASLIESVIEGFNATVFAYGQTGCGKSFTMEGPTSDLPIDQNEMAGIIPRACADLFDSVALSDSGKKFLVHASYLEIYNENVRDLLADKNNAVKPLDLKEHPDRGVYVKGLTMHRITTAIQAQKLMDKGWSQRATGETLMNQDSSRSHAIFTIYVETEENENIRAGKLHLVDLAGSERQSKTKASGQRLKEAAKINLSLSALGNVISSLVDGKSKHIPYRDSKLTRILQDSLGGNTKTLMIACISPADNNYDETLSTLRYADRAKQIKNAPRINEDPKDALLRQYADEIKQLKELLNDQLGVDGLKQLIAAQKSGQKINLPPIENPKIQEIGQDDDDSEESEKIVGTDSELDQLKRELAKAIKRADMETEKRERFERELTLMKSGETIGSKNISSSKLASESKLTQVNEYVENLESDPEIFEQSTQNHTYRSSSEHSLNIVNDSMKSSVASENMQNQSSSKISLSALSKTDGKNITKQISELKILKSTSLEPASASHEKQLARLMELQRGFVRSTHIDNTQLDLIKKKKKIIKSKQAAAEKRRELARKAVEAQNDEEMFQALFENVHEDVRFQKSQVDKAKEVIGKLRNEIKDLNENFESEKKKFRDKINEREKEVKLLDGIIDKIQPTVKRDCNYYNVDRIKKQAIWDEETKSWELPRLRLEREQSGREGIRVGELSSRQSQLLNRNSSVLTNSGHESNMRPRRLQPLRGFDNDDF